MARDLQNITTVSPAIKTPNHHISQILLLCRVGWWLHFNAHKHVAYLYSELLVVALAAWMVISTSLEFFLKISLNNPIIYRELPTLSLCNSS